VRALAWTERKKQNGGLIPTVHWHSDDTAVIIIISSIGHIDIYYRYYRTKSLHCVKDLPIFFAIAVVWELG
jgi:hypothetical protein